MKTNDIHVIITSAGSGKRFKNKKSVSSKPKQYINLLGKPVILHSLLKFQKEKAVKSIIISAEPKYFNYLHTLCDKFKITKIKALVEGGSTRFHSVRNAFNQLNCNIDDIIMIHDAARPNFTGSDIKLLMEISEDSGEVILGSRITETVKRTVKNTVSETISRDNLWLIHTPQAFRYHVLSKSYILAGRKIDFTDESSMVEYAGFKVCIADGSRGNIKITSAEDMKTLKKIMV